MKTRAEIQAYYDAYESALVDVRRDTSGTLYANLVLRACLIRKWAKPYDEAVAAEARNRALNEVRALEAVQ